MSEVFDTGIQNEQENKYAKEWYGSLVHENACYNLRMDDILKSFEYYYDKYFLPTYKKLLVNLNDFDRFIIENSFEVELSIRQPLADIARSLRSNKRIVENTIYNFGSKIRADIVKQFDLSRVLSKDDSVEWLNLDVGIYNCVKRFGLHTIGSILEQSDEQLLKIRNFGQGKLALLDEALEARNFVRKHKHISTIGKFNLINLLINRHNLTATGLNTPIHKMGINYSAACLLDSVLGIKSIKDLINYSEEDLLKVDNIGKQAVAEIIIILKVNGLKLSSNNKLDFELKYIFSDRVLNILKRMGINNIEDLADFDVIKLTQANDITKTDIADMIILQNKYLNSQAGKIKNDKELD